MLWRIHIRQMWIYALPGLCNVWMLLIKSTSLLSLLQIVDIVSRADSLGAPNFSRAAGLVHPDWRWGYYLVLLVFYIALTFVSEKVFAALIRWAGKGMIRAGERAMTVLDAVFATSARCSCRRSSTSISPPPRSRSASCSRSSSRSARARATR